VRALAAFTLALALVATAAAAPGATRKPAPPLIGTTLDGKQLSLAKLRGKPVFINVWSSW
jgi:cytochrome c biogenesis protein CcmG/thiol:disulfide interchange protein DsbE